MLLIIDHRNTHVRCDRQTLIITRGSGTPQRIPIRLLGNIVVIGNPTVESNVWRALTEAGVPATLLPGRGRQPPAVLGAGLSVTLPLRRLQYRCAEQPAAAIRIARWLLQQKIASYQLPLSRLQPHQEQQQRFEEQRERAQTTLATTHTIDGLMGVEGSIANAWFKLLAETLPENWRFTGRNRQPPRDPVNALLSLGYTLLMSDVHQIIISEGLDPAFGYLHQPFPAREALMLDITEIFRAGVDTFVLSLLENLKPSDFNYHSETGCRLNKAIRPRFYNAWAEQREEWPRPQATPEQPSTDTPLQEQIRGRIMALREVINETLEEVQP